MGLEEKTVAAELEREISSISSEDEVMKTGRRLMNLFEDYIFRVYENLQEKSIYYKNESFCFTMNGDRLSIDNEHDKNAYLCYILVEPVKKWYGRKKPTLTLWSLPVIFVMGPGTGTVNPKKQLEACKMDFENCPDIVRALFYFLCRVPRKLETYFESNRYKTN